MLQKHIVSSLLSIFLLILVAGCGTSTDDNARDSTASLNEQQDTTQEERDNDDVNDNEAETDKDENEETEEDPQAESNHMNELITWMPRLDNVFYAYEGSGFEYASYNWWPQFNQDDYYQIAIDNGGTVMVETYEYRDNEIVRVFRRPETYFRDNFSSIGTIDVNRIEEVVLKAPIAVGTSWATDEASYEITAIDQKIQVPAGTYTTIEVTIQYDNSTIKKYYAEYIGLVYEVTETEGYEIESKLEQIYPDTYELIPLTVYLPDDDAIGLNPMPSSIVLETNEPARMVLRDFLSGKEEGFEEINILPEDTEINYLYLDRNGIVNVDLSQEYITNMNAGAGVESLYLASLVNTLTQYYGAQEALLTIDGEQYESGHILLREGEKISFNEDIINN